VCNFLVFRGNSVLLAFPKYNDFFVKNLHFFAVFFRTQYAMNPSQGMFCCDLWYEICCQKKLYSLQYPMVKTKRSYHVHWFWLNTGVWRTDMPLIAILHMCSRYTTRTVSCYECAAWTNRYHGTSCDQKQETEMNSLDNEPRKQKSVDLRN